MAVPALRRVDPAMISWSDRGSDHQIDKRLQFGLRIAGHQDDFRFRAPGPGQRTEDELRDPACRHADDDILAGRPQAAKRALAFLVIVLGPFAGPKDRTLAAGNDGLHEIRIRAEGRRDFGSLQDTARRPLVPAPTKMMRPPLRIASVIMSMPRAMRSFSASMAASIV